MQTGIKKALPLLGVMTLPLPLFAAPTVTFQGEVSGQTCDIQINGRTDSVVLLPTVSLTDFGAPLTNGQFYGQTPFTVSVSGCQSTSTVTNISTNFLGYNVDAMGVLGNGYSGADAATGFGIQLMDAGSGGTAIRLSGVTSVPGLSLPANQTEASYDYGARYYVSNSAAATPGKITAIAEYSLSYL
ncbi:fimbrial protein [Kosakonia radicincitans]|uniref:fimbrial protein n=1 Tax=Kosakonia radicincitans TaxID=283686 RepID=UPI0005C2E06D|nr:fimbrial protein [Kosakonia radicincitans]KIS42125.1 fimbrial family protein [Kosakonia radicincitans YD4]